MANDLKGYYKLNNGNELKRLLKEKFNYNFSVRRKGHWYHVDWIDGPGQQAVNDFLSHFEDNARDDIMTDLWCGSQYIIAQRSIGSDLEASFVSYLQMRFGWPLSFGSYGLQVDDPECSPGMAESLRREFLQLCMTASA